MAYLFSKRLNVLFGASVSMRGVICRPELNTSLTEREMEVFRLIASNYQTDDIAAELHISPCTVNRHRENIKAKIKVRNVGELIAYWHQNQMK